MLFEILNPCLLKFIFYWKETGNKCILQVVTSEWLLGTEEQNQGKSKVEAGELGVHVCPCLFLSVVIEGFLEEGITWLQKIKNFDSLYAEFFMLYFLLICHT